MSQESALLGIMQEGWYLGRQPTSNLELSQVEDLLLALSDVLEHYQQETCQQWAIDY
jgi:hypothetical protein